MQASNAKSSPAATLAIVGGALMVVASFLPWAKLSATGVASVSAKGFDGWEGKVTLIAGALIAVRGFLALSQGKLRNLAVPIGIGGLIGGGVALYTIATVKTQLVNDGADDVARLANVSVDQAKTLIRTALDSGAIKVSISIGLYLVILGAVLAVVAAVLGLRSETAAPQPGFATGGAMPSSSFGTSSTDAPTPPPTMAPPPAAPTPPSDPGTGPPAS